MIRFLAVTALAGVTAGHAAGRVSGDWAWQGRLEAAARYNSNLSLLSGAAPVPVKEAFLAELAGRLEAAGTVRGWEVDAQWSGLADRHTDHAEEDWYFARGRVGLRRDGLGGTFEASQELRYYTVPRRDTFDFVRNLGLVAWRRPLGRRWQVRAGYQGNLTGYPQSPHFDYTVHGVLAEVRARWRPGLTAHAAVDLQRYAGEATPRDAEAEASPEDGRRLAGRLGLDWLRGRHVLSATYSLQEDEADLGVQQIGDIEGPDGSQDTDADFDLVKHKATLLYSVPLSRRWLLGSYAEWIRKEFDDEERLKQRLPRRTDTLVLAATHLRLRLDEDWALKVRYLFRSNRSSVGLLDYDNHVVSIGIERQHP